MNSRLFLAFLLLAWPARGDIRVLFANRLAGVIDAPVTWLGGYYGTSAPLGEPSHAQGPWFRAQLHVVLDNPHEVIGLVGEPVSFRTGAAAGYVSAHEVVIPTRGRTGLVTARVQMVAWCRLLGESFTEVQALGIGGSGVSQTVYVGGHVPDIPIGPAPALVGLHAFNIHGPPGPVRLPPTEPAMLAVYPSGDGRLRYRLAGLRTGWLLNLETSTNLVHWRPWLQPWLPRGPDEFTFEVAADGPARFFRGGQP